MNQQEKILALLSQNEYKMLKAKEIAGYMAVPPEDLNEFLKVLDTLVEEGRLFKTKKNKYSLPEMLDITVGTIRLAQRGFGFVTADNEKHLDRESRNDRFVPAEFLNGAMDGDRVMVKEDKSHFRQRSIVIKILERNTRTFIAVVKENRIYSLDEKIYFNYRLVPENKKELELLDGKKVIFKIIEWPDIDNNNIKVAVDRILGDTDDPRVDVMSVIHMHGLSEEFDEKVIAYAERIIEQKKENGPGDRVDLRNERIITIDGDDAKDLDDAISIKITEQGFYELGVHIADVSHYVEAGSILDKEAYNRATSVYLLSKVVPMLPAVLSNDVCSLNPKTDKLTLSVTMIVDKEGSVISHNIFESIIRSSERMTYDDVFKILKGDQNLIDTYSEIVDDLRYMEELAVILRNKRFERGAIDFDFVESKIILDDQGKAVDILKQERTISEKLIEEFMILCNETVSEHFFWTEIPFVYRIHEEPDSDKMIDFAKFVNIFGYKLKGKGEIHPRELQKLIASVKGKKEEKLINTILLRSLKKARYSNVNLNHFGLASKYYSHFTSPIRRYPDLLIHRIIKENLSGNLDEKKIDYYKESLEKMAYHCSERERNADNAENTLDDIKKAEYMMKYIGVTFKGLISSVASFGFFVDLDNTVEGLVKSESIGPEYFEFNERTYTLKGELSGKEYRIGDTVYVRIDSVNKDMGQINFMVSDKKNYVNDKNLRPYFEVLD